MKSANLAHSCSPLDQSPDNIYSDAGKTHAEPETGHTSRARHPRGRGRFLKQRAPRRTVAGGGSHMSQGPVDVNRYLYEQIYSELKDEILGGTYRKGDWFPPERVLKDRFNTTHLTVRNALAKLVLEGYIERYSGKGTLVIYSRERTSPPRKSLRFPHAHLIFDGLDEANALILGALEEQLRKVPLAVRFSLHRGDVLLEQSLYREAEAAGALVIIEPAGSAESLAKAGTPLRNTILVRGADPALQCPQVAVDDAEGARKAVRYLLDLGHGRITLLAPAFSSTSLAMRQGFVEELAAQGMPAGTGAIESCAPGIEGGILSLRKSRDRDEQCRAFICASDEIAAGAARALAEAGLVPGTDCALIGYGNTRLAQGMGMTTIDPCFDRLAERVVTTTMEAMSRGTFADDHFQISPELRIRDTSARMKQSR
jgi:DNA-binding LacI/PurR family transcriptional regulator/DNA-binding transcriptional regulator YhcF (GntR family)